MTVSNSASPSRFNRFLRNFFRGLIRLFLVILLGILIGSALYLGGVFLYSQFQGSQSEISDRLSILETGQASSSSRGEETAAGLQERITALEQQQTFDRENFSSLQSGLETLQQAINAQTQSLEKLNELEAEITKMTGWLSYESTQAAGIQLTQTSPDSSIRSLRGEIKILRAMQLLNRARLFILQSNYGLAAGDLEAARAELQTLQAEVPPDQQETVAAWIARLDRSLAGLPASPVQASSDLDLAWDLLAAGLPVESASLPEVTPTPTAAVTKTPTPTPNSSK